MARAKRTDRAEARRRHRERLAAEAAAAADEQVDTPAEASSTSTPERRAAAGDRVRPGGSIRNAFRLSFRPLTLREDLRLLPRLLLDKAFWIPVLVAAVISGVVIAFQGRELISRFAADIFIGGQAPPVGGSFLLGFLAPRASYLLGAIYGAVAAILLGLIAPYMYTLPADVGPVQVALYSLATYPVAGSFFAAAAAWYRRFLYLASPARQLPPRGRPARGR